jgi:hypothetical protein
MSFIALRMLFGDRAKYFGVVFAIGFCTFLLESQTSTFANIMRRSGEYAAAGPSARPAIILGRAQLASLIVEALHANPELRIAAARVEAATLLGQPPGSIPRGLPYDAQPIPPRIDPGLPVSLAEGRPDLREAGRHVAAAARSEAARRFYFPRVTLGGLLAGLQSGSLGTLLSKDAFAASVTEAASWTATDGGRRRSSVAAAAARLAEAAAAYERRRSWRSGRSRTLWRRSSAHKSARQRPRAPSPDGRKLPGLGSWMKPDGTSWDESTEFHEKWRRRHWIS